MTPISVPYVLTTLNVGIREICSLRGIRLLGYKGVKGLGC